MEATLVSTFGSVPLSQPRVHALTSILFTTTIRLPDLSIFKEVLEYFSGKKNENAKK